MELDLSSKKAIRSHVALAILFPSFLALGYWQYLRATGGNTLSWAYTFEWPILAIYAVYLWWKMIQVNPNEPELHFNKDKAGRNSFESEQEKIQRIKEQEAEDAELAAYNRYLEKLSESDPGG